MGGRSKYIAKILNSIDKSLTIYNVKKGILNWIKNKNPVVKLPTEIIVTLIAIAIPIIPNKLPCLEVSGEERPLRAKINSTPEIR